jgi:hypothetical protein
LAATTYRSKYPLSASFEKTPTPAKTAVIAIHAPRRRAPRSGKDGDRGGASVELIAARCARAKPARKAAHTNATIARKPTVLGSEGGGKGG